MSAGPREQTTEAMDFGLELETARTEYNACGAELRHCQQQLENAQRALISAAEQYGCALAREGGS